MADDLLDLIRTKQRDLQAAENLVFQLRRELEEAKRLLLDGIGSSVGGLESALNSSPVRGNSTEWAETVLGQVGHPLHVNEIISSIEREFHIGVRYATLVGNIARLVKKGKIFERVGPNVFGLLRWNEEREEQAALNRIWEDGGK